MHCWRCWWSKQQIHGCNLINMICWQAWMLVFLLAADVQGVQQITNPRILEHPEDLYATRNDPATLNCKAEGEPPPVITWYRDGQLVVTANENPHSSRMLLPSGQLFFLRVLHNKNSKQDVGNYYCNATNPETMVSVISRTARLEIAVIKDDFREQPASETDVAIGHEAVLHCKPPRGEPEPKVRWEKEGQVVELNSRITVDDFGTLKIEQARKDDAGTYICVAHNSAGERESSPATLYLREKPVILQGPQDTVVAENGDVLLQCHASGDSELVTVWKKQEGQIPAERSQLMSDQSLRIQNAQVSDEGVYVCRVENSVGFQEAKAKLTVHSRPVFVVPPKDKVVVLGSRVAMRCEISGNPVPVVFWKKVTNTTFIFPNQNHGRFSVTESGTLTIESVRMEDAGEYSCHGLSISGSALAKGTLEVRDVDPRPAPVISIGPQNQTLPTDGVALMPCVASGEPLPGISWLKNNVVLSLQESRITIVESGTLQISDLRHSDTGMYTCKAVSETGETSWSAALVVEPPTKPNIIFHRTPEQATFPGAPSRPVVTNVTDSSVRLSWKANNSQGASSIIGYTVEYFSQETGEGWVTVSDGVFDTNYFIRNLHPNTSYVFLVRARNSHGLSLPSPISNYVKTKGESVPPARPVIPNVDESIAASKLSDQVVHMLPPEVLSSTMIKLNWEVRRNMRYIEGFYIKYRIADERNTNARSGLQSGYTVESVRSPSATMYVLSGLQKYCWYEIRIQPYYSNIKGTESNPAQARTLEDVPSAPPRNIKASILENDTLHMVWEPPARLHQNGILLGYKIYIYGNETKYNREFQVNSSTDSLHVRHIPKESSHRLQISAFNRMGEGEKSDVIHVGQQLGEVQSQSLVLEPWLIGTMVATLGGALWLALCVFTIYIYKKRKAPKKGPIHRNDANGRPSNTANQMPLLSNNGNAGGGYQGTCLPPCCFDNKMPSDVDSRNNGSPQLMNHTYQTLESLQKSGNPLDITQGDSAYSSSGILPPELKTFYTGSMNPPLPPYATSTLAGFNKTSGSGRIPNPEAYMIQQSSLSSMKPALPDRRQEFLAASDINKVGCDGAPPGLFLLPPPDQMTHSDASTYHSDKCRMDPGYGWCPPQQTNVHPGFNLPPPPCSDCELGPYDSPCDRLSSLDSHHTGSAQFDGCRNGAPALTDPRILKYDLYAGGLYGARHDPNQFYTTNNCNPPAVSNVQGWVDEGDHGGVQSASSSDAEIEFANAVAQAAELSGLTTMNPIVENYLNSTVNSNKAIKKTKHRQRAQRSVSPYSTDSSYSAAAATPRRPYPKSERKKQLQDRDPARNTPPLGLNGSEQRGRTPVLNSRQSKDDLQYDPKSTTPYFGVNNFSSKGRNISNSNCGSLRPLHGGMVPHGNMVPPHGNMVPPHGNMVPPVDSSPAKWSNPIAAFDTRDTPIV